MDILLLNRTTFSAKIEMKRAKNVLPGNIYVKDNFIDYTVVNNDTKPFSLSL